MVVAIQFGFQKISKIHIDIVVQLGKCHSGTHSGTCFFSLSQTMTDSKNEVPYVRATDFYKSAVNADRHVQHS